MSPTRATVVVGLIFGLLVFSVGYSRLAFVGEPGEEFLDQNVLIPNISSFDSTGITVRELHNFYHSGPLSNVSWERLDQRRVILHASGQDALTRQSIVLAWQFLIAVSDLDVPHAPQGPRLKGAYVERLALNGEIAPMQVIQMAMGAIVPEILRARIPQKK